MMMECPRCGFVQPKDQYCASCGLDIDHYTIKPKPILVRIVQNPNLHLLLIGLLVLLIVGYIFYSQRALVSRQVEALFSGTPLTSRDSGDADNSADNKGRASNTPTELVEPSPEAKAELADESSEPKKENLLATVVAPPTEVSKVEVSYWEVPRETLNGLIATAQKLGESNGGRAYFFDQGAKALEICRSLR